MTHKEPKPSMTRRQFLGSMAVGSLTTVAILPRSLRADAPTIKVYKSPTCGCCDDWIVHLEDNGFVVSSFNEGNSDARKRLGMPARFGSCHTGEIDGYAIEGHVPAREILRLIDEKPQAIGLSVPAMPRGSPGMDGPMYGDVRDPYDVLLIDEDGTASVYQSYR